MPLTSKRFWRDTAERAVRTFAQSALATMGVGAVNVLTVDWQGVLGVGAGAAVISLLMSLASERVGDPGTASVQRLDA